MRGISNYEIEEFLSKRTSHFKGVFSSNNIPCALVEKNHFSIICNHAKKGNPGTHFVVVIVFPSQVIYIDSFGKPCKIKGILNFLFSLSRPVYYNSTKIQASSSSFCGFYCMMYVLYFSKIFDKEKVCKIKFDPVNLKRNDKICINEIKKLTEGK